MFQLQPAGTPGTHFLDACLTITADDNKVEDDVVTELDKVNKQPVEPAVAKERKPEEEIL